MFWDKVSPLYDAFETVYNGKVFNGTGEKVAEMIEPTDVVLECACGTGANQCEGGRRVQLHASRRQAYRRRY